MTLPCDTGGPPVISVITVVLNGAQHLEQCLRSVRAQLGVNHEHIVIDGGSIDGSQALIQRYEDGLAAWRSEPDQGIGDAMNKGAALARGEWLLFLHADDHLTHERSLSECRPMLQTTAADIVGFPIHFDEPETTRVLQPRGGGWWLNLKTGLLHQSCFVRRQAFERIGAFDLRFRVAMDYEFFLRARRRGLRIATYNAPIPTRMGGAGLSSQRDWLSLRRRFQEEHAIHVLHAQSNLQRLGYAGYWAGYWLYRRLRAIAAQIASARS